jgi:hypothetical protein
MNNIYHTEYQDELIEGEGEGEDSNTSIISLNIYKVNN